MNQEPQSVILIRNASPYDFGGGERFPVFLAEELKRQNYKPILLTRSEKLLTYASEKEVTTLKSPWWNKQNWSGTSTLLFPVYILWQIYLLLWYFRYFLKEKPSVVHIQSKDDFIGATFAGKLLGCRIVWTDHADLKHVWKNIRIWYKNPTGKLVYIAARFADVITVVSHSEEKLVCMNLGEHSFVRQKIKVVYNGAFDSFKSIEAYDFGSAFTFLAASRLVDDKGIREAIEATKQLAIEHRDIQLVLLGDGPNRKEYEQLDGEGTICFYGHQSDPLPYIKGADVFIHPTYHEGFSVALVEASMLCKPIIATSVGGNLEIIHDDQTGLLVEARSATSLYTAMKYLKENDQRRDELGKTARTQYTQSFNFPRIVKEEIIPLYKGDAT